MTVIKNHHTTCRDGSFVVIFCKHRDTLYLLLAKREDDRLWEFLGGGFDLEDLDAQAAAKRELQEEAGLEIKADGNLTYFAHMTQRVKIEETEQKGHVFYFLKELSSHYLEKTFNVSEDHLEVGWHTLTEMLSHGENRYKTATLRMLLRFLQYKEDNQFQFGILREKVKFDEYEF